jgi:hypothetical protein
VQQGRRFKANSIGQPSKALSSQPPTTAHFICYQMFHFQLRSEEIKRKTTAPHQKTRRTKTFSIFNPLFVVGPQKSLI